MPPIKLIPTQDYTFALELTYHNMAHYYQQHNITWEDQCFAKNWEKSENFEIRLEQQRLGVLRLESDGQICYLADLQIMQRAQGQGIGSYVLHYVQQLAQVRKQKWISLIVFLNNPALRLYERHDFKIVAKSEILARMERTL